MNRPDWIVSKKKGMTNKDAQDSYKRGFRGAMKHNWKYWKNKNVVFEFSKE